MKPYQFSGIFVRTPLFSFTDLEQPIDTLLHSDAFKAAIYLASRSLYHELSKKNFNYHLLSEKEKITVRKYLNRAAYRSTPFGMFSGISAASWTKGKEPLTLGPFQARLLLDFQTLHDLTEQQLPACWNMQTRYCANTSLYRGQMDYRLIKKMVTGTQAAFSIVSVEKNVVLKALLAHCKTWRTGTDIIDFLTRRRIEVAEAISFCTSLLHEQILIWEHEFNITGEDPLQRMIAGNPSPLLERIADRLSALNTLRSKFVSDLSSLSQELDAATHGTGTANHFYAIGERAVLCGGVSMELHTKIEDGMEILSLVSGPAILPELEAFKKAFIKKYDERKVPLLEAIDPQLGVGYGSLDRLKISYGFSSSALPGSKPPKALGPDLLSTWAREWTGKELPYEIEIKEEQLSAQVKENKGALPPGLSVIFRPLGDKVFIESVSGPSSLALVGRFAVQDEVDAIAKTMAAKECAANPQVIFAEIAHLCNLHTANINRRPHFYPYEIPVLTHSTLGPENVLSLQDLLVSVHRGCIVLRSRKLNKIIIPRLSSAFNYNKSDFSVFRFLCDLQHQELLSDFRFPLPSIFPHRKFYPRVVYKSAILRLAEWHLERKDMEWGIGDPVNAFREKREVLRIPRHFSYAVGDHFLVIDSDDAEDLQLLQSEVVKHTEFTIREFPFLGNTGVKTDKNEPLLPQYLACLQRSGPSYPDVTQPSLSSTDSTEAGDTGSWIYRKLYCHPLSSDLVLQKEILPMIGKLKRKKLVKSWFWIRYHDPEYHLRIRILPQRGCYSEVLKEMSVCLDRLCRKELLRYYQTDKYHRELDRYSPALIEQVEKVFEESSHCIGRWLIKQDELYYEDRQPIRLAVASLSVILSAFGQDEGAQMLFCKNSFEYFFKEFQSPHSLKQELERLSKEIAAGFGPDVEAFTPMLIKLSGAVRKLRQAWAEAKVDMTLDKLAGDIIHMHINRIFIHEQRYFEMVTYFLVYRALGRRHFSKEAVIRNALS